MNRSAFFEVMTCFLHNKAQDKTVKIQRQASHNYIIHITKREVIYEIYKGLRKINRRQSSQQGKCIEDTSKCFTE